MTARYWCASECGKELANLSDGCDCRPPKATDPVNHPSHYTWLGGIEVIDITEHLGFCLGNVVKYVLRADHKGEPVQDLEKARWYLDREIQRRTNQ